MPDAILSFLDIDDTERLRARRLWEIIAPQVDSVLECFYARLAGTEPGDLLAAHGTVRLNAQQKKHWERLFAADFSEDYQAGVRRIGLRHREIGLDPRWYIASYSALKLQFIEVITGSEIGTEEKTLMIRTLEKFVAIDLGLALSAYSAAILE